MKTKFALIAVTILMLGCGEFEHEQETTPQGRTGATGEQGPAGETGATGAPGQDGTDGRDGRDGEPCSVVQHLDGATITCPDGTVAEITHGSDGQDGERGARGRTGEDGADGQDGVDGVDNTEPIYVGYYCSRTVLRIGGLHYVIHSQLIPLNSAWLHISSSCEMRLRKGKVETRDP